MKASPRRVGSTTWRHLLVAGLLGATILAVSVSNPAFATVQNFRDLLVQSAPVVIVACGMTVLVMGGRWITDLPPGVRALGTGAAAGIPVCLWAAALVSAGSLVLARRTRLGVRIYAVGGNTAAAALARVPTARVRVITF